MRPYAPRAPVLILAGVFSVALLAGCCTNGDSARKEGTGIGAGVGAAVGAGVGYGIGGYQPSFWPPPRPSGMVVIPSALLASPNDPPTLSVLNLRLLKALNSAGYVSYSYFSVPSGFALVTQLEQINDDGTPLSGDTRFSSDRRPIDNWSLIALGHALFVAREGYYRIIVFIVSPVPFAPREEVPTAREAREWVSRGMNTLSNEVGELPYTEDVKVTALVYELLQSGNVPAVIKVPGRLPARTHLERGRLWAGLQQ